MRDFESTMTTFRDALSDQAPSETETNAGWLSLLARVDDGDSATVRVVHGDGADHRPFERRRWLAVAATLLVLLGAAATLVSVTRDSDAGPVASPTEPLFLLPEDSGYVVSDGLVDADPMGLQSSDPAQRRIHAALLGKPDGDGFGSLIGVTTFLGTLPADDSDNSLLERKQVTAQSGPAVVLTLRDIYRVVVQQRGDYWIQVHPAADVSDESMIAVLDAAVVIDGRARFDIYPLNLREVMSADVNDLAAGAAVTFQVSGNGIDTEDDGGPAASVDTLTWPMAAAMSSPTIITHLEPFTVDGANGWLGSRPDDIYKDDGYKGVVWQTSSGHVVGVSGVETVEALVALATSLTPVDEQTWRTATTATDSVPPTESPSPEFCSRARNAAEGQLALDDPEQINDLTNDPSLPDDDRGRLAEALEDASRRSTGGAWSNDRLVEIVNELCNLELTPVTLVE